MLTLVASVQTRENEKSPQSPPYVCRNTLELKEVSLLQLFVLLLGDRQPFRQSLPCYLSLFFHEVPCRPQKMKGGLDRGLQRDQTRPDQTQDNGYLSHLDLFIRRVT